MNTKRVGDTSEALVLAELVGRGYRVSVPFGDNDRYDLVVETGVGLRRVQVKTGWQEDECIRFKTGSQTTDGGTVVGDYSDEEIDAFAVRCRGSDRSYCVPIEAPGRKSTYLRVEDAEMDHPGVRDADDYGFENASPPR